MKKLCFKGLLLGSACVISAAAIAAPGEDTIQLQNPVEHLQLPLGGAGPSRGLDSGNDIPTSLKAKIVRYEAKSFTEHTEGIFTDADINRTVQTQANRKTCVQDVGSNVASSAGIGNKDQIVVLRGDLINVCR